ncbi:hypothetical protein MEG05_15760 [Vibrio aestuarianus]|uniref:hypothetical protein n=1 Tax=Vibrio aestuarianus TaxID=28171 RepID=UPI00237CCC49|nr:hypothetical protein [Vibrio aestuarianus]MDE1315514.1 hypothetical protein [Vibrio aestuarianus]
MMLFKTRSKLTVVCMILISGFVGLKVGQYSPDWGAASMLLMYISLAVIAHALGKVKH